MQNNSFLFTNIIIIFKTKDQKDHKRRQKDQLRLKGKSKSILVLFGFLFSSQGLLKKIVLLKKTHSHWLKKAYNDTLSFHALEHTDNSNMQG